MTTEELQRLLDRSDSDKDHVRYDARDKLDAMAPELARELIAARKVVEAVKTATEVVVHTGYDNGPGGGNFVYSDAILMDEITPALTAYDQACSQSAGEG